MSVVQTLIGNVKGPQGERGAQGVQGEQGEAATISVGSVTTVPYGTNASVVNSGTEQEAVLDFRIPQGRPGEQVTQLDNLVLNSITEPSTQFPIPAIGDIGSVLFGKVSKWFSDMSALVATKLNAANVVNNLTTTASGYALDARQGKTLNDFLAIHEVTFNQSVNSGLTVTDAKIVKSGRVCQLYLAATANTALSAWTVLVYGVPDGYKPYFNTANAFGISVGSNRAMANMNGNGTINTVATIANGEQVRFCVTYITA